MGARRFEIKSGMLLKLAGRAQGCVGRKLTPVTALGFLFPSLNTIKSKFNYFK